ncbi:MAG: hypothetical protein ACK56I_13125, partial [bacterium]
GQDQREVGRRVEGARQDRVGREGGRAHAVADQRRTGMFREAHVREFPRGVGQVVCRVHAGVDGFTGPRGNHGGVGVIHRDRCAGGAGLRPGAAGAHGLEGGGAGFVRRGVGVDLRIRPIAGQACRGGDAADFGVDLGARRGVG